MDPLDQLGAKAFDGTALRPIQMSNPNVLRILAKGRAASASRRGSPPRRGKQLDQPIGNGNHGQATVCSAAAR